MARLYGDLKTRSFLFGKAILDASDLLPDNVKGWTVGKQVIRCGTSVGANVREADTAYTDADFAHRCNVARREAAETHYWLELCVACELLPKNRGRELMQEAEELLRVLSTIVKKVQTRLKATKKHVAEKIKPGKLAKGARNRTSA